MVLLQKSGVKGNINKHAQTFVFKYFSLVQRTDCEPQESGALR